jgi:hypothetical protein
VKANAAAAAQASKRVVFIGSPKKNETYANIVNFFGFVNGLGLIFLKNVKKMSKNCMTNG